MEAILTPLGLANREEFSMAVRAAALSGRAWTVLLVDLDRFSHINEHHGWVFGDAVLATVADRLRSCVGTAGAVTSFGADDFGVLVTWSGEPEVSSLVLDEITAVERPMRIRETLVEVGCTIGVGHAAAGAHPTQVLEIAERDRDGRKAHRREAHVTTAH